MIIREGRILELSENLDDLSGDSDSKVARSDLFILPGFIDTHTHLIQASYAVFDVQIDNAKSLNELIALIKERANSTPEGTWIRTSAAWHEMNLLEKRFPTAKELDEATTKHPVLVKRGGHNDVVNSYALRLAGITKDTLDPKGGRIGRDENGEPNGLLVQSAAQQLVEKLLPTQPMKKLIEGLSQASLNFASLGITTVRDAAVNNDERLLYQTVWKQGRLAVRVRPMITIIRGTVPQQITALDGLAVSSGFGDEVLKIWGLKAVMDGGAEAAALVDPYANNKNYTGFLFWKPEDLIEVLNHAVRRGWKVGTHCVGDRAVKTTLDVYEKVIKDNPEIEAGSLVLEHAFLADDEQRARAIKLGVSVTVQHPPIFTLGSELVENFGAERAGKLLPVRSWIEEGAVVAAGDDYPAGTLNPMGSMWGLVTRKTGGAGVLGADESISRETAIELYTREAARLIGEFNDIGTLEQGKFADFVAFEKDPFEVPIDEFRGMKPVLTVVGGNPVFDPYNLFPS